MMLARHSSWLCTRTFSYPLLQRPSPGGFTGLQRPQLRTVQSGQRGYRVKFGSRPQYQRFGGSTGPANFFQKWAARPSFYREVAFVGIGAGGIYVYNLEDVPISGRRRFNIVSPALEATLAEATMEQIKQQYRRRFLPPYDARVRQVQRVLDRLIPYAESAGLKDVDWEVYVIHSEEQNAFVIPGGKVFVFTGILKLCQTEDNIAAVLGHEIAHVVAHHQAERMSQAPFLLIGALALWSIDFSFYTSRLLLDLFLSRPGSRKQEAEADFIGLMMMARACYRPEAALSFWDRMEKLGGPSPPDILSTHPSHHNRQEKIREWLPKAQEEQEGSECQGIQSYADQFARVFGQGRW